MHEKIGVSFEAEKWRSSSDIPLRIPISLGNSIKASQQHIMPYIKLATFIKQRFLYILLQYKSPRIPITTLLLTLQSQQDIIQWITNRNTITAITELSWLNYPHVFLLLSFFLLLLELAVVVVEYLVLGIIGSFGDVEGERKALEDVETAQGVVFAHVVE